MPHTAVYALAVTALCCLPGVSSQHTSDGFPCRSSKGCGSLYPKPPASPTPLPLPIKPVDPACPLCPITGDPYHPHYQVTLPPTPLPTAATPWPSTGQQPVPTANGLCSNSCPTGNNGRCEDGGPRSVGAACNFGTDCQDCGTRSSHGEGGTGEYLTGKSPPPSPTYRHTQPPPYTPPPQPSVTVNPVFRTPLPTLLKPINNTPRPSAPPTPPVNVPAFTPPPSPPAGPGQVPLPPLPKPVIPPPVGSVSQPVAGVTPTRGPDPTPPPAVTALPAPVVPGGPSPNSVPLPLPQPQPATLPVANSSDDSSSLLEGTNLILLLATGGAVLIFAVGLLAYFALRQPRDGGEKGVRTKHTRSYAESDTSSQYRPQSSYGEVDDFASPESTQAAPQYGSPPPQQGYPQPLVYSNPIDQGFPIRSASAAGPHGPFTPPAAQHGPVPWNQSVMVQA